MSMDHICDADGEYAGADGEYAGDVLAGADGQYVYAGDEGGSAVILCARCVHATNYTL
jgi:hypothetical protein